MAINCTCDDDTGDRNRGAIRTAIIKLMGWAAISANPPPGVADYINEQLYLAHKLLWRRFPAIRTERWFSWALTADERFYGLVDNGEGRTIPTPVNAAFGTATTGGALAPGTYSYRVSAINANGETLASTATTQVVPAGTSTNTVTVNWSAPTVPAGVSAITGYQVYGRSAGTELLIATVGLVTTYVDTGSVTPAGALPASNTTSECTKLLDPYSIREVWYERDTQRTRLCHGVPSSELARTQTGWPTHYEIRQCIEIWPAPDATEGTLRVKARFQPTAFEDDAAVPGVPDDMVLLLALAACKRHYNKPDANDYIAQMEVLLSDLTAGTHQTAKYIPGEGRRETGYVEPMPSVPFS